MIVPLFLSFANKIFLSQVMVRFLRHLFNFRFGANNLRTELRELVDVVTNAVVRFVVTTRVAVTLLLAHLSILWTIFTHLACLTNVMTVGAMAIVLLRVIITLLIAYTSFVILGITNVFTTRNHFVTIGATLANLATNFFRAFVNFLRLLLDLPTTFEFVAALDSFAETQFLVLLRRHWCGAKQQYKQ